MVVRIVFEEYSLVTARAPRTIAKMAYSCDDPVTKMGWNSPLTLTPLILPVPSESDAVIPQVMRIPIASQMLRVYHVDFKVVSLRISDRSDLRNVFLYTFSGSGPRCWVGLAVADCRGCTVWVLIDVLPGMRVRVLIRACRCACPTCCWNRIRPDRPSAP